MGRLVVLGDRERWLGNASVDFQTVESRARDACLALKGCLELVETHVHGCEPSVDFIEALFCGKGEIVDFLIYSVEPPVDSVKSLINQLELSVNGLKSLAHDGKPLRHIVRELLQSYFWHIEKYITSSL